MTWISEIIGSSLGQVIDGAAKIIDDSTLSKEEQAELQLKLENLLMKGKEREKNLIVQEMRSRERVLVAELNQGDSYTKRARPTIVYSGLVMIAINYVLAPMFFGDSLRLPDEFWAAWAGVVATWSIGRSFEKAGVQNKITRSITGEQKKSDLL